MTEADVKAAIGRLRGALASQLSAAARLAVARDRQALSRAYPPASRAGEYPALRSGRLAASADYNPKSLGEIADAYSVILFRAAPYDVSLRRRGRLGIQDTVRAYRPELAALFGGGVQVS
jgi:hypothetical protein